MFRLLCRIKGITTVREPLEIETGKVDFVPEVGAALIATLIDEGDGHVIEHHDV